VTIAPEVDLIVMLGFSGTLKCWIAEKWRMFIIGNARLGDYCCFS